MDIFLLPVDKYQVQVQTNKLSLSEYTKVESSLNSIIDFPSIEGVCPHSNFLPENFWGVYFVKSQEIRMIKIKKVNTIRIYIIVS